MTGTLEAIAKIPHGTTVFQAVQNDGKIPHDISLFRCNPANLQIFDACKEVEYPYMLTLCALSDWDENARKLYQEYLNAARSVGAGLIVSRTFTEGDGNVGQSRAPRSEVFIAGDLAVFFALPALAAVKADLLKYVTQAFAKDIADCRKYDEERTKAAQANAMQRASRRWSAVVQVVGL